MNENWTANNPAPELSDTDAELLSAYIDDALEAQERTAFEARLAADAFLRSELAAMRQMLGWLNTMPTLKAPRNFTITEADVKPIAPKIIPMPRRFNWQVASTAAAVFVVLIAFVAINSQLNLAPKQDLENIAFASTQENQTGALLPATSLPLPIATMGAPQVENSTGTDGLAQTDEQEEAISDVARSGESDLAYDPEMNPSADAEFAPRESSGSGGSAMDNTNPVDSSMAAGSGPVGETSAANLQVQPTLTGNYEIAALATGTPQPTSAAVQEESMMMSVAAESTDEPMIAMSVPVEEEAADAQIAMASVEGFVPRTRLIETIRSVYERLIAASQN